MIPDGQKVREAARQEERGQSGEIAGGAEVAQPAAGVSWNRSVRAVQRLGDFRSHGEARRSNQQVKVSE